MSDAGGLLDWLERAATIPGAGLVLVDRREEERRLPWSIVRRRAGRLAAGLVRLGVGTGDRIALVFPTGEEFFTSFFGVQLAGAVPVPLYPPVRLGRLDEYHARTAAMLRAVEARLLLSDARVRTLLGETVAAAGLDLGCRTPASLAGAGSTERAPASLALVQFSSGTTVDPKPVALSHRAVAAQVRRLNAFWPEAEAGGVSWLPLYHDMGLIGCVFPALERPGPLALLPPEAFVARPALWLRAISRHRATVSPAPDFAYALAVERIRDDELEGVDLSSWRVALDGAEPIAARNLRRFRDRFRSHGLREAALTPVYGLSEAALAVTFSDIDSPFRSERFDRVALAEGRAAPGDGPELVCVGRPLPDFEVRVVDADDRPVAPLRVGRVRARGPSLMDGYLGRPDLTRAALRDGWLETGDLGFLDEGGELWITGRAKDAVILRGRNHAPAEIEAAATGVEGARTGCAAAVGRRRDDGAEELVVFLERSTGAEPDGDDDLARRAAEAVLGATGLEGRVLVVAPGTLPRTSSGKLRRGEALRRWESGRLTPPRDVGVATLGRAWARSAVAWTRHALGGGAGDLPAGAETAGSSPPGTTPVVDPGKETDG